jgi:hypothetical protein
MSASNHFKSLATKAGDISLLHPLGQLGFIHLEPPAAANASSTKSGFYGVSLSIQSTEQGLWNYVITQLNINATHHKILACCSCDDMIVAQWRQWGQKLHLPLYVEREAGILSPLERFVGDTKLGPRPSHRRGRRYGTQRSPRRRMRRVLGWRSIQSK